MCYSSLNADSLFLLMNVFLKNPKWRKLSEREISFSKMQEENKRMLEWGNTIIYIYALTLKKKMPNYTVYPYYIFT